MSNLLCVVLKHKDDGMGVCLRCGEHFDVCYGTQPPQVRCQCPKCPGHLRYDGYNPTRAFLICSVCRCCYHSKNSKQMLELR